MPFARFGAELRLHPRHRAHPDDIRVLPDLLDQGVLRILQQLHDILIQRVHILHQPLIGGIVHIARVMGHGEVGGGPEVGFGEFGVVPREGRRGELLHEGFVRGLGEPALVVQQTEDAHRLLDQIDGRLQVQPEIDKGPLDALALVFLLFEDKHGVIKELLELFVGVVDAELLEGVHLKPGNKNYPKHSHLFGKRTDSTNFRSYFLSVFSIKFLLNVFYQSFLMTPCSE